MKEKWVLLRTIDSLAGFASSLIYVVVNFVLHRLKDPGRERTEARTLTATRTSSKTAVRCCVARHTRGNCLLYLGLTDFWGFFWSFCQCKTVSRTVVWAWWHCFVLVTNEQNDCFVSPYSVLDRRGLLQEDTLISSSNPVPQTTVSAHKHTHTCTLSHCSLLIQTHRFVSGWRLQSTE